MVKRYRKKPVIIEAYQYLDNYEFNYPNWFYNAIVWLDKEQMIGEIRTLEGNMRFHYGDYIVKGIIDEVYVVNGEIFEASYEEVK